MTMSLLGFAALAALCCALMMAVLIRWAPRLELVDEPGGHKHHHRAVPVVGGIAIALTCLIGVAKSLYSGWADAATPYALLAALLMLGMGLWDDRHPLSPRLRFVGQTIAALVLAIFADVLLQDLGALLDGRHVLNLSWFAWPMTVFSVVGVMNACNMSDGMDGSAGGLALLALIGVLILLPFGSAAALLPLIAAAAVVGFLIWNLPWRGSARAYLGDGGSLFLGTLLAWVLVRSSQGEERAFAPVLALWLYALPLIDTVSVMWRRVAEGHSPFEPDQRHVHHLLLRAGMPTWRAWSLLMLVGAIGAALAIAAHRWQWPEPAMAAGFLLVALVHHLIARRADRRGVLFGRQLSAQVDSTQGVRTVAQP